MNSHTMFIVIVMIINLVITAAVLNYLIRKRGLLALLTTNLDKLRAFNRETSELAQNHVRANYSGNPEDLPAVLTALLDQIEHRAREQELPLNRDALKMVLLRSLQLQEGLKAGDLQKAMRKVA